MPIVTRRDFFRTGAGIAAGLAMGRMGTAAASRSLGYLRPGGAVSPGEWWAGGGPREAPPVVTMVSPGEPGERLALDGTVYGADGLTPLSGVTVYVYQTDARGLYNPEGKFGVAHRLRGWANTDDHGRYEFHTIKPGHYPSHVAPAHIHMTVCRRDMPEWWLPEVRFEGDPLLNAADYQTSQIDQQFGNVRPVTIRNGELRCTRDLRL
jgi:protocatechuate 3,4-dioxygenase beta subunit